MMKIIYPVPIQQFDFTPFGYYYNLKEHPFIIGGSAQIYRTPQPVMSKAMRLGITACGGGSFTSKSMERHISTEELLFPGDKPIILAVADNDPEGAPNADDIRAVVLRHGDLVVLKAGIWHDACRADCGDTQYYFMAKNDGSARETEWVPVQPCPVWICVDGSLPAERG